MSRKIKEKMNTKALVSYEVSEESETGVCLKRGASRRQRETLSESFRHLD